MRVWAFALMALVLGGCVASPTPSPPEELVSSAEPATDATPEACAVEGIVLEDAQALRTGGSGEDTFEVPAGCSLEYRLQIEMQAGGLEVFVSDPNGEIVFADNRVSDSEISTGGLISRKSDPAIPGTYTYTYHADAVADFHFVVTAS